MEILFKLAKFIRKVFTLETYLRFFRICGYVIVFAKQDVRKFINKRKKKNR